VQSFHPAYTVEGPATRLACILRLRMVQDKQLQTRLRQAKLVVDLLELQEAGVKERLASAFTRWEEAANEALPVSLDSFPPTSTPPPSSSSSSLSGLPHSSTSSAPSTYSTAHYPVKLMPSQTYRLPSTKYAGPSKLWIDD